MRRTPGACTANATRQAQRTAEQLVIPLACRTELIADGQRGNPTTTEEEEFEAVNPSGHGPKWPRDQEEGPCSTSN